MEENQSLDSSNFFCFFFFSISCITGTVLYMKLHFCLQFYNKSTDVVNTILNTTVYNIVINTINNSV